MGPAEAVDHDAGDPKARPLVGVLHQPRAAVFALPTHLLELYLLNGPSPEMDYALLLLHQKLCILRSDTAHRYRPFPSSSNSEELTR